MAAPQIFDRRALRRRRNAYASSAEDYDYLVRDALEDLVLRLSAIKREFDKALDLSAGRGLLAERLLALDNVGTVIACDPAFALARRCTRNCPALVADDEALPFAPQSLDLVASVLGLQFVNDLAGTLAQIRRALRPDGLFIGAMLGGETLRELRYAFAAAEYDFGLAVTPRVPPFADIRALGALLQRAEFALPVVDADIITVTYEAPLRLLTDLRAMGATGLLHERSRAPMTPRLLTHACDIYVEKFALENGRVPATFEILSLTGWAPHDSQQKPLRPGSASHRLADALNTKEIGAGENIK